MSRAHDYRNGLYGTGFLLVLCFFFDGIFGMTLFGTHSSGKVLKVSYCQCITKFLGIEGNCHVLQVTCIDMR